ncbi:reduced viability upon starvation protein-like protein [Cucurbitaria berberidis CBS 394.84]|uniref:Reduced viability upon starvation protein-like protein n=1 Tax=Cucurbitaria berberidis CBS 394.84 TaxID=1168544 RepID=A0A9P4LA68_9PLEO|nr:reduced viability upon starvation protein-like protein [Cucurbitaria berberidis CBS 394.84]KAF1847760.1 reduced viability upon starvation protein-like protein [Cucurbitaria berberidis CBS 394.84]
MSWKGLTKSVTRAPQTIKQKFNIGEITKDPIYLDAERRFDELEKETKKLHEESKKYFDAVNGMLSHQIEFSKAIAEVYKPISGRMSDPDSFLDEGNTAGIEACDQYETVVRELQETLKPELEMIESRVIRPADELLAIIKAVRKIAAKRDHKQLDYDRHRTALKKLQDKKDKTLKDEKAIYRAESDVEQATQDFNYFNDLLKEELPKLFSLEREFIKPLFQSFYYMQLNVFYTLHERMQRLDIGYFDLTLDIEAAYEKKRGDTQEQAEKISIVKFKTTGGRVAGARPGQSKYATKALEAKAGRSSISEETDTPPPPYSPGPAGAIGDVKSPALSQGSWGSVAKSKGAAPPPPKPKPSRLSGVPTTETVTALYDYEAQAEGDLSFLTGDVIEIVSRTQNDNEWWIGKVRGKQGQFPGNYVKLSH